MNKKSHSNLGGNAGSAHPGSMSSAVDGLFKKKAPAAKKTATPPAGKRKHKK